MLQPNATGDGDARLTSRSWLMVALTGVATGLLGDLMMSILFSVQHLAFGVNGNGGGFEAAVERASGWHRVIPLLIAGVVGGPAWYLLRRFTPGKKSEVDDVLWTGAGLACDYNVPLGGALFAAEVLLGTMNLPVILPAVACSGIATLVAWIHLPSHATYADVPATASRRDCWSGR